MATLVLVPGSTVLDLHAFQVHMLIKHKREDKYYLVVNNKFIKSVTLPFPACTDVRITGNRLYDLAASDDARAVPMNTRVGGGHTNDELDWREKNSPAFTHNTLTPSPE